MDPEAHEVWKELAGPYYDELVQSKEKCLAHLSHANSQVRMAAINICDLFWDCSADDAFVEACRVMAMTDPDESMRSLAIEAFGRALQSSQDPSASRFLADTVKASRTSEMVRMAAYWALREVQTGSTLDGIIQRAIALMKLTSREASGSMTEEQLKNALFIKGHFAGMSWDSVDQIDWDFVNRYAG